jgi:hypothetical protein
MLDNSLRKHFLGSLGHSSNDALFGFPACNYDEVFAVDDIAEVSTAVNKEMDEYRNKHAVPIVEHNQIPMIWYRLIFPPRPGMSGVQLSVREIYQSDSLTDDTTLELEYHPTVSDHKIAGKHVTWWASWNVVIHDIAEREGDHKHGKVDLEAKKSKAAMMAEFYAKELYGSGSSSKYK